MDLQKIDQDKISQNYFPDSNSFLSKIETLTAKLPAMLEDFKKYYVFYNKFPDYSEYKNMFNNIKNNLQSLNSEIFVTTNDVEKNISLLNDKLVKYDGYIDSEKNKNVLLKKKLGIVETKFDGSDEMVHNYTELYNIYYTKNFALFLGILISIYVNIRIFFKK